MNLVQQQIRLVYTIDVSFIKVCGRVNLFRRYNFKIITPLSRTIIKFGILGLHLTSWRPCWRSANKRISLAAVVFGACFPPPWPPYICGLIYLKGLITNHQWSYSLIGCDRTNCPGYAKLGLFQTSRFSCMCRTH